MPQPRKVGPGVRRRSTGPTDTSQTPGPSGGSASVHHALPATALVTLTDPASLGFATTAELPDLDRIVGQDRAVEAVEFALDIRREGYNLYALGPEGIGKSTVVHQAVEARARREAVPSDWCYVHGFADPARPHAIRLPAGRGSELRTRMEHLVVELKSALRAAFENNRYRSRRTAIEAELNTRRDAAIEALGDKAREAGVAMIRTPVGVGMAPMQLGEVVDAEHFALLPEAEQARLKATVSELEEELAGLFHQFSRWEREARAKLRDLDRETTRQAATHLFDEVRHAFAGTPDVLTYLDAAEADVVAHAAEVIKTTQSDGETPSPLHGVASEAPSFRRLEVNVVVDHAASGGAPVVYEDNPTYSNLIGRVEHVAQLGALLTDFGLIRAGALHRANGGYLVLEARKLLSQPYSWDGLKRVLRSHEIAIESLGQALNLIETVSLQPEPIPCDVKVVLVGDRELYYLLAALDPDFPELFKVQADFDEVIDRTPAANQEYAMLAATTARREGLRPLDAPAVARLIEHASRLAGDAEKVSVHMRTITDLLREADFLAGDAGRDVLLADDIQRAIDGRLRRAGRVRARVLEAIERGTLIVETRGERIGQVNGLTVAGLGDVPFGAPTRITARVRLGRGELVDIEREVALGGPLHTKGVLILAGFLGGRYAERQPLGLHASLVFEQSYGGVEGDSASLGELCALLSAIGDLPIRQSCAVTGSVDQHGRVQPIGGVNDKIEGFFDVCAKRGLTGAEGVIIPASNVRDLMLRADVVAAAEGGGFGVYPVTTVDEALEILTGLPAGERQADGSWSPGTANARIADRLAEQNAVWQSFHDGTGDGSDAGGPAATRIRL